jgi:hypothetical protein
MGVAEGADSFVASGSQSLDESQGVDDTGMEVLSPIAMGIQDGVRHFLLYYRVLGDR